MRWAALLLLVGCDRLIGIEDPRGVGGGTDGGRLDGAGGPDASEPCHAAMPTYGQPASYPVTGAQGFAVGDLDGDGDVDIAIATQTDVVLLFNDGTGHFGANRKIRPGENVAADDVAIADVDGDGRNDVVSWSSSGLQVNLHDATTSGFLAAQSVPGAATAVFAGQLDGAGGVDLAVVDDANQTHVLLADASMPGGFVDHATLAATAVALADVDSDGNLDLVMTFSGTSQLGVAYGDGAGTLALATLGVPAVADRAASGKFSTDAHLALVASTSAGTITVYRQTSARTFSDGAQIFSGLRVDPADRDFEIADANHDGRDDVVGFGQAVTQCTTPGPFGEISQQAGFAATYGDPTPTRARLIDVNGDGHPDVVETALGNVEVFPD